MELMQLFSILLTAYAANSSTITKCPAIKKPKIPSGAADTEVIDYVPGDDCGPPKPWQNLLVVLVGVATGYFAGNIFNADMTSTLILSASGSLVIKDLLFQIKKSSLR